AAFGGKLVLQSLYLVPEALLRRELAFRPLSLVRVAGNLADSIAKIIAAALGLHIWCFVIGPLAGTAVTLVGIQRYRPWWAAAALLVKLTRQNLLVVAPLLVVIGVAADDLLAVLYPPLGGAAATAARILCAVGALRAMSFVLPPMLAGLGHARDGLTYNAAA